jgi:hypothetical protein
MLLWCLFMSHVISSSPPLLYSIDFPGSLMYLHWCHAPSVTGSSEYVVNQFRWGVSSSVDFIEKETIDQMYVTHASRSLPIREKEQV